MESQSKPASERMEDASSVTEARSSLLGQRVLLAALVLVELAWLALICWAFVKFI